MRVLQVVRPAAGGIRRHVEILTTGLIERGIETEIAAPPGFQLESPARVIPVQIQSRPHPISDLRAAKESARAARDFDLLHGHGLRGAWIACLASRQTGKPFILTAHNLAPAKPGFIARALVQQTLRRANGIITVSRAVADSLKEAFGPTTAERVTIIPGGIDLVDFDRYVDTASVRETLGIPLDSKLVVAIGRLAPEKGFERLVAAASVVPDPAVFVIAGEGVEKPKLEQSIEQYGLKNRVRLVGYWKDAASLLKAADLVVVPSHSEGQGLAALEGMAAAKPVIATRVGGLAETVVDGVTGVLVPPGDPFKSLGRAILDLLEDEPARQKMGEAGRARVEQLYSAPLMISRTIDLYNEKLTLAS